MIQTIFIIRMDYDEILKKSIEYKFEIHVKI